jgi:hypothetical protein
MFFFSKLYGQIWEIIQPIVFFFSHRVLLVQYPTEGLKRNESNSNLHWRMVSSGLLRRVALIRTDVSEVPGSSFIRVTTTDVRCEEAPGSFETSVLTRATRRNNPEDTILQWRLELLSFRFNHSVGYWTNKTRWLKKTIGLMISQICPYNFEKKKHFEYNAEILFYSLILENRVQWLVIITLFDEMAFYVLMLVFWMNLQLSSWRQIGLKSITK